MTVWHPLYIVSPSCQVLIYGWVNQSPITTQRWGDSNSQLYDYGSCIQTTAPSQLELTGFNWTIYRTYVNVQWLTEVWYTLNSYPQILKHCYIWNLQCYCVPYNEYEIGWYQDVSKAWIMSTSSVICLTGGPWHKIPRRRCLGIYKYLWHLIYDLSRTLARKYNEYAVVHMNVLSFW